MATVFVVQAGPILVSLSRSPLKSTSLLLLSVLSECKVMDMLDIDDCDLSLS